jgi:hypothetical protein
VRHPQRPNEGTIAYTYDAESQIKTAAGVTYAHDGDRRRVYKSSGKLYCYGDILAETDGFFDILLALKGEDSYGARFWSGLFGGFLHNRPTSAEDNEEALLLGCPPIGPF